MAQCIFSEALLCALLGFKERQYHIGPMKSHPKSKLTRAFRKQYEVLSINVFIFFNLEKIKVFCLKIHLIPAPRNLLFA